MSKSSNVLAIGTSRKETILMDASKFQQISTIGGQHSGRISSLAWNPSFSSVLSSGGIDSLI
jgi:hypothetical protein